MSAVIEQRAPLDISNTSKVPMTRLIRVELRKMADTRAGIWLLAAIVLITAAINLIFYLTADTSDRTFLNFMGITATPQGFLLPVLGILLVTSEWTQRTALVSFTLTPVRIKLLIAKVVAALLFGLAAIVAALAIASLATLIGGADNAWQAIGIDDIGKFALLQATGILQGLAFGLLFLNSAAAIVTYFVLPTAFSILSSLWGAMADVAPWIDLGTSQTPLFMGANLTGEQWAQIAVGTALWVVLPFLVGVVRVLRAELK